jgi:predicted RNA-binding protein (virulence factor B family)
MAELGTVNTLSIVESTPHGLRLEAGPLGQILLPNRFVTSAMRVGDRIEVFLYNDSEDRPVATTEHPYAQAGELAVLDVVSVHPTAGAFLDWGLSKDLLLPFREQGGTRVRPGEKVAVAIYLDAASGRVAASTRLHRHLPTQKPAYEPNQPVEALVYGDSPLGCKVIVERRYRALLYHEETADQLRPGDRFTGYIKKVHHDGKIDLRRDAAGYSRVAGVAGQILAELERAGGYLPYHDKSSPEAIRAAFDTSKKAFKQAIGQLYKAGRIELREDGIKEKQPR